MSLMRSRISEVSFLAAGQSAQLARRKAIRAANTLSRRRSREDTLSSVSAMVWPQLLPVFTPDQDVTWSHESSRIPKESWDGRVNSPRKRPHARPGGAPGKKDFWVDPPQGTTGNCDDDPLGTTRFLPHVQEGNAEQQRTAAHLTQ